MSFFAELKRRNVVRVGIAYVVLSWLILQMGDLLFDLMGLPDWANRIVLVILLLGFPVALIFSWIYELTPEGVKRESEVDRSRSITPQTGRKLDYATLGALAAVVVFVLVDRQQREPEMPAQSPVKNSVVIEPQTPPASNDQPASSAAAGEPERRASVAVLPFTTRSTSEEDTFFADGIHDDVLTRLAKIAALKVISRTSVMEYRDTTKKIPEIAGELGVATVLEGAVQRAGQRVRINAQLIDAETDEHLWAETFDREMTVENLFDIQSDIATAIAAALKTTLSPEEQAAVSRVPTENLEAWAAYRRAVAQLDGITQYNFDIAGLEARQALSLDPGFAGAYGIIARVHMSRFWFFGEDPEELEKARQALDEGRKLDPSSAELDVAEAYYHYWGFLDYDRALEALDRGLAMAPNDTEMLKVKGFALRRAGRYEEAMSALERAHELDPRSSLAAATLAETLAKLGHLDEAQQWMDRAIQVDPSPYVSTQQAETLFHSSDDLDRVIELYDAAGIVESAALGNEWIALIHAGRYERAYEKSDFGELQESRWSLNLPDALRGVVRRLQGRTDDAEILLARARAELERRMAQEGSEDPRLSRDLCQVTGAQKDALADARKYCALALENARPDAFDLSNVQLVVAQALAMAGDVDGALEALEMTLENPARVRSRVLRRDPMLAPLREDPRFEPLMERIDRT